MDKTNPKESIDPYATLRHGGDDVGDIRYLIPGFEILEEIGRGAFGAVYRARDTKLDRQVAIKISLLDDPTQRDQYIKEAQNAARLDIAGIVPVYQVGTFGEGQPFVVQKLVDGSTLSKEIRNGKITLHRACTLMAEIAGTVAQAHEMELIHRDLKPDNILIDSRGKPWVADFGLAILEKDQKAHRGEKAGTPLYMSPEQLQGRAEWLDGRTDIYSMGVMLYELLCGRTPYDATTFAELEDQVLHRDPKPISQRSPHIPVELDTIFQNCCAKQVADRYANAFELAEDLQEILDHTPEETLYASGPGTKGLLPGISRRSKRPVHQSTRRDRAGATIRETTSKSSLLARTWWIAPLILLAVLIPFIPSLIKPSPVDPGPNVPPTPEPLGPLIVAKDNSGTFLTIQAALDRAQDGEIIYVQPGNYKENLTIHRSITIKGKSEQGTVVIIGQNSPAFKVVQNAQVELANLAIEVTVVGEKQFNTIEVGAISESGASTEIGTLKMTKCVVDSKSFDGVNIHAGSAFNATGCNFRSEAHPGIRGKDSKRIEIFDCYFQIEPLTLQGKSIPTGIQVDNCEGIVRKSRFRGKGNAVGIDWALTDGQVLIDEATFESCDIGIVLTDCKNAKIGGALPVKMNGCRQGVFLQRSIARLQNLQLSCLDGKTGIRVFDQLDTAETPLVEILDSSISYYQVGLGVENSTATARRLVCSDNDSAVVSTRSNLTLSECTLLKSKNEGLQVFDSKAILENSTFRENTAGISVDGGQDALECVGVIFESNKAGLIMFSGEANFRDGLLKSNTIGIAVQARRKPQYKMPKPVHLTFERTAQEANETFMAIVEPCSFSVKDCEFPPPNYDAARLRLENRGNTSIFQRVKP